MFTCSSSIFTLHCGTNAISNQLLIDLNVRKTELAKTANLKGWREDNVEVVSWIVDPTSRGFDEDTMTHFPCGGMSQSSNRIKLPLSGGSFPVALEMCGNQWHDGREGEEGEFHCA
jgi:hypothetical protein